MISWINPVKFHSSPGRNIFGWLVFIFVVQIGESRNLGFCSATNGCNGGGGSNGNLDKQITQLVQCKPLFEPEVLPFCRYEFDSLAPRDEFVDFPISRCVEDVIIDLLMILHFTVSDISHMVILYFIPGDTPVVARKRAKTEELHSFSHHTRRTSISTPPPRYLNTHIHIYRCMAGEGERKRKGIDIDYNELIRRNDGSLEELLIQKTAEMRAGGEELDPQVEDYNKGLSDKDLNDKIVRHRNILQNYTLNDGGQKMRNALKGLEAELERRNRQKDDDKCKKVTALADDSTCNGATNGLSHPGTPPPKPASEFASHFCSKLDNERATRCFGEELSLLNRSDHKRIRENRPFSAPLTQKRGFSSRQAPFKSPHHLSVNIDNQQQTRIYASNPSSPHPSDRDSSSCSTKRESGARSQPPLNSRRNNRKTFVLVDEEEHDEVEIVNEADQVGLSRETRIYYPSRNDPKAIEICYSDMECLAPETYLSSPIMNFYIRYLQKTTSPSAERKHDYHIFNTYFYEKLKQDVLTKTEQTDREASFFKFRRWWKGMNIFEKAYIFLPIHESLHWSLVIICIPNKEDESRPIILHLDSLGLHSSRSIFSNVKSFLIEEWKFLRKEEVLPKPPIAMNIWNRLSRKIDEKVIEVPQQRNEYDCGLFVLFFMERFIEEAPERLKKQNSELAPEVLGVNCDLHVVSADTL
ncbi:hypothetical protein C2S52_015579 [Perilla frutescens var. hirtella]|nr:hypothetical protein C2S52_015579 [Perilla frutescens var. hirtella]